jgi:hypothetical protein
VSTGAGFILVVAVGVLFVAAVLTFRLRGAVALAASALVASALAAAAAEARGG